MAIILFSAADVSPPFLNLDGSATFSTLGSANADRPEKHTAMQRWEQDACGLGAPIYFDGLFLQVFTAIFSSALSTSVWPPDSLKIKLRSH